MPIANANTGISFAAVLNYVELNKDRKFQAPMRVLENNCAGPRLDIAQQMAEFASERPTCKKPVLHFQINFHPEEKLTPEMHQKAVGRILELVGVNNGLHQYTIHQHFDKPHAHFHVVLNRVGLDTALFNDHKIKDRLQVACDRIEKELSLRTTTGRTVVYDPAAEKGFRYVSRAERGVKKTERIKPDKKAGIQLKKEQVNSMVTFVLEKEKPSTAEEFRSRLLAKGVEVDFKINKTGIFGISFKIENSNVAFKGSDVGYKWAQIRDSIGANPNKEASLALTKAVEPPEPKILPKPIITNTELPELLKTAYSSLIRDYGKHKIHPVELADQACREYGKKFNAIWVWDAWNKLPNHEELYHTLYKLAEKSLAEKPKLTPEMKLEAHQQYIAACNTVLANVRSDLQKEKVDTNPAEILRQAGFKEDQNDQWTFRAAHDILFSVSIASIERISEVIRTNKLIHAAYNKSKEAYQSLMARHPDSISLTDRITGKSTRIKEDNERLIKAQKETKKPVFTPELKNLNPITAPVTLLPELKHPDLFRSSSLPVIQEGWNHIMKNCHEKGFSRSESWAITNQNIPLVIDFVIKDRKLDDALLCSSDREVIGKLVQDEFKKLNYADELHQKRQQSPEPDEPKIKRSRGRRM